MSALNNNSENIKVSIRIRPFLTRELGKANIIFVDPSDDRKIKIGKDSNYYEGFYDKVFGFYSTQVDIFNFIKDSVGDVFNGVNCTIFAYGQTGSGKTYTMFGADWTSNQYDNIYPLLKPSSIRQSM